jgi:hypothetical protein
LPGHPDIPTVLIYAFDDEIFEPDWERFMARELLGIEPIEISGGHFPMVEDPEALARVLDRVSSASTRLPYEDWLDCSFARFAQATSGEARCVLLVLSASEVALGTDTCFRAGGRRVSAGMGRCGREVSQAP